MTGAFLHLIGDFDRFGQCVVDNAQNFLVLHPDHLLSSTTVGDSFSCTRKAVLQDRVKTTSDANQSTIYGSMLHEIFQEALRKNRWDNEFMAITIDTIAKRYLETLFEISIEHSMAIDHLKARVVDLQAWAEIFVAATPKVDSSFLLGITFANFEPAKRCCQRSQRCPSTSVHQQTSRGRGESLVASLRIEGQC